MIRGLLNFALELCNDFAQFPGANFSKTHGAAAPEAPANVSSLMSHRQKGTNFSTSSNYLGVYTGC